MFSAYVKIKDDTYREVFGLDFEDYKAGQVFHHRPGITLSQQDNCQDAMDTLNAAELHYNADYARETEWKHCLVVSTLTLQKVLGSTWKTFARKNRIISFESIEMTHPVFGGDTLYAKTEILATKDQPNSLYGELLVKTHGVNQHQQIVVKLCYRVEIFKRGQHPYYRHIYFNNNLHECRFSAYLEHNNTFIETAGLYYEDLRPGETFQHFPNKTISPAEADRHALHSLDWNPKYIDPHYYHQYFNTQQSHNFCPIVEHYVLSGVTACTTRTFGKVTANLAWTDVQLHREIYPNEYFTVHSKILSKRPSLSRPDQGIIKVAGFAFDKRDQEFLSFKRTFLVHRRLMMPTQ